MIIVSQDKAEVINFNNIVRLSADVNTNGEFLIEVHNFCDDFETVIGFYETEERAKEVLQKIIEFYEWCEYKKVIQNINIMAGTNYKDFVFEMPER